MNPSQTGLATNLAGLILLIAASQGVQLDSQAQLLLTQLIAGVGLVINQWLIQRAHKAVPPIAPDQLPTNSQSGFFIPRIASVLFVLALAVALLPGCTTLGKNVDQSKLITQVAVMKIIEADRDSAPARAAKIEEIAGEASRFLDADSVSVSMLADAISVRIAILNLEPSDRLLAAALVDAVVGELQYRVGTGVLSPEQKFTVSQVLGWVIDAAEFYQ